MQCRRDAGYKRLLRQRRSA